MSKKRVGLTAAVTAGAAARGVAKKSSTRSRAPAASTPADRSSSTAITIAPQDWRLLRAVAFARVQRSGGRASVSAVIAELIEQARPRLMTEAGAYYSSRED